MKHPILTALLLLPTFVVPALSQSNEGVLIRCGASSGHSYFFRDSVTNPNSSFWEEDGMKNGKINLVRLGSEWDIQFSDILGESGYRSDGAKVLPLIVQEDLITVGAFHTNYVDIYTFNREQREVAWTSSKHYPFKKVAVYRAPCS